MDKKEIGSRIKKRRKELKLTQKELAQKIYRAEVTVRQYEGGVHEPDELTKVNIANVLNCSYGDLFGDIIEGFDTGEEFDAWRENYLREASKKDHDEVVVRHHPDGTVTNEIKHVPARLDFSDLPDPTDAEMRDLQDHIDFLSFKRSRSSKDSGSDE